MHLKAVSYTICLAATALGSPQAAKEGPGNTVSPIIPPKEYVITGRNSFSYSLTRLTE